MDVTLGHLCTPKLPEDHFWLHTHETYEIYYMLGGSGVFYIEDTVYSIAPGTLLLMRPGEMHRAVIEPDAPYERMFLHFSENAIRAVDPELRLLAPFLDRPAGKSNRYSLSNCNMAFIDTCFKHIDQMIDTNYNDALALRIHLLSILSELKNAFAASQKQTARPDNNRISQVLHYIQLNLTKKISKQQLCDLFFISPSHLSREFKKATGLTLSSYIQLERLTLADRLLHEGEPATGAALSAGFKDYSAFYRAYRAHYHISPRQAAKSDK